MLHEAALAYYLFYFKIIVPVLRNLQFCVDRCMIFWTSEKIGGHVNLTWSHVRRTCRNLSLFLSLACPSEFTFFSVHESWPGNECYWWKAVSFFSLNNFTAVMWCNWANDNRRYKRVMSLSVLHWWCHCQFCTGDRCKQDAMFFSGSLSRHLLSFLYKYSGIKLMSATRNLMLTIV